MNDTSLNRRPLIAAGAVIGMGMGGFVDGIVFHQMLQTHSMFSAKMSRNTIVGIETNMFWDGVFHAGTWLLTALGVALLWRATGRRGVPHSTSTLLGSVALGWGIFNLVEGTLNHHIFHLHHVVEIENHLPYDIAFLASGVVLAVVGWALIAAAKRNMLREGVS